MELTLTKIHNMDYELESLKNKEEIYKIEISENLLIGIYDFKELKFEITLSKNIKINDIILYKGLKDSNKIWHVLDVKKGV